MQPTDHPDTAHDYQTLKSINRGARQAADTAAMDAMWEALESGLSKEEANKVFFDTYNKFLKP